MRPFFCVIKGCLCLSGTSVQSRVGVATPTAVGGRVPLRGLDNTISNR